MLAQRERAGKGARRGRRQLDRVARHAEPLAALERHLDHHVARAHLRVVERLRKIVDRAARNARRAQPLQPVRRRPGLQRRADDGVDPRLGREARRLLAVGGIAQFGQVDALDEALEEGVADAGDDDVPIGGGIGVVRHVHEVAVADARRHLSRHEVHGRHVVEHRDLRVQHRDIHMLSAPGALALGQHRQHAHGAEQAAAQVADGDAAAHRSRLGRSGNGHAAAHALDHLVERGTLRLRSGLPEAGHRTGDDARVDPRQRRMIDAQALRHAHAEVVEHHVGLAHQVQEDRLAGLALEVHADALLVAVQRQVVGAHAVARIIGIVLEQAAGALAGAGRLHLDGARAQVGKQHRAVGAGKHVGQVQHGNVLQRQGFSLHHVQCDTYPYANAVPACATTASH
ncbi:Uncharacterised protein [Bordetella parapertussis]|nr:Uncharacterised protein [Bordetella parapertussis]SUV56336.1 Uncharacterised protein [Bordetella parapertussis]SUV77596.1 Uncharacterised protein [Bordetella parapertussis]VEF53920.1 Uncharacterised protein [Bordetella parapertussis]VTR38233.1 Uncharacterised protein [Bordetella parapertussis]